MSDKVIKQSKKIKKEELKDNNKPPAKSTDIDKIFDSIKSKKQDNAKTKDQIKEKNKTESQASKIKGTGAFKNKNSKNAKKGDKYTDEGFKIYTEEELGLNKEGGGTDLCPFDCDCCY